MKEQTLQAYSSDHRQTQASIIGSQQSYHDGKIYIHAQVSRKKRDVNSRQTAARSCATDMMYVISL